MRLVEIIRYLILSIWPSLLVSGKKTPKADGVIITMTTLPSRIANIAPTIASLSHQSVRPERILLNLPTYSKREQTEYKIPDYIKKNPLVEINETAEDLGPATKLLPALRKYWGRDDKLLIIADDDEIYAHDLVKNYLTYEKESKDSVLTMVGWDVPEGLDHAQRIVKYGAIGNKPKKSQKVTKLTQVDCVQGASTFAVRPTFFSQEVFDYSQAPKEAFFVDDIYVSGHIAKQKVPVYVTPAPFRYARMKVLTHLVLSETLHRKENKTGHNNNTLYQFYRLFWHSLSKN